MYQISLKNKKPSIGFKRGNYHQAPFLAAWFALSTSFLPLAFLPLSIISSSPSTSRTRSVLSPCLLSSCSLCLSFPQPGWELPSSHPALSLPPSPLTPAHRLSILYRVYRRLRAGEKAGKIHQLLFALGRAPEGGGVVAGALGDSDQVCGSPSSKPREGWASPTLLPHDLGVLQVNSLPPKIKMGVLTQFILFSCTFPLNLRHQLSASSQGAE